ncbi:hypothetical protein EJ05DRAFT_2013 [Pseudovirgaria hyperparasitica]|uniref:Uncharacterized protein n=1 Tax=Pseudovirgaria hyperparasitica TaxID=470096 RepID=A0A6A6WK56_9PEZI|nr:uncharacterized protein EJ05DRAFT_2013 [Pseudovirgaria hyperparasitica]KAF2762441.1 hypothetical protein EJ05DRAFT_2013 [Pseudovirgaria hyperparasitica]
MNGWEECLLNPHVSVDPSANYTRCSLLSSTPSVANSLLDKTLYLAFASIMFLGACAMCICDTQRLHVTACILRFSVFVPTFFLMCDRLVVDQARISESVGCRKNVTTGEYRGSTVYVFCL